MAEPTFPGRDAGRALRSDLVASGHPGRWSFLRLAEEARPASGAEGGGSSLNFVPRNG